jgi:hypothetical protein
MTNATVSHAPFGKAPKVDNVTLPTIKTVSDDNKVGAAIGSIGGGIGGIQRLACSTAYYLGDMATKAKVVDYKGEEFWTGFYSTYYAARPLSEDAAKQAKSNCLVYIKVAQLPYDARLLAETMFDHPFGSMNQKATALRKMMDEHKTAAPSDKAFKAYLPAAPKKPGSTTLVERAGDVYKSLNNVYERRDRDDSKNLWAEVNANDTLKARYDAAVAATKSFFEMAETIANKKTKGKGKTPPPKGKGKGVPEGATVN